MTPTEYWKKEIEQALAVLPPTEREPGIVAALLIARQLREAVSRLDEIRSQLRQIEDQLADN